MAGADITMLGDKGLERMLKQLPDKAQDQAVRFGVRKAAEVAKQEMLRRVPTDTGELKQLLAAGKLKSINRRGVLSIGSRLPTREELGIPAEAKSFWPSALEYGHAFPGHEGKDVAPRPFMRPAIDENRPRLIGIVADTLRKKIPKIAAKLAKK